MTLQAAPLLRPSPPPADEPRSSAPAALRAPCDGDLIARLRRTGRVWAVGAIHGDRARLAALHQLLANRLERGDRLVYLGGYLGHGPDVAGTIDELLAFRRLFLARRLAFPGDIVFLRGAQEEMWQKLLQLQFAPNPREILAWMMERGVAATLASYGGDLRRGEAAARDGAMALTRWTASLRAAIDGRPGHRQLLTQLKRAALTDDGALLFVHAGIDAEKPLDLQGDVLWWGGTDLLALAEAYGGFRRVVRGFDRAHGGLRESRYALSLDGGSGRGGPLIAAAVAPDGKVIDRLSV